MRLVELLEAEVDKVKLLLELLDRLFEGWLRGKEPNTFSAEASDIDHHRSTGNGIRCPKCRDPLPPLFGKSGFMDPVMSGDADNEVTRWEGECPKCKAGLTIFND